MGFGCPSRVLLLLLLPQLPLLRLAARPLTLVRHAPLAQLISLVLVRHGVVVVAFSLASCILAAARYRRASTASFGGWAGIRLSQPLPIRSARPTWLRASWTVK